MEKSNRKIHIIFAIFTLFLSMGISFIDVSANDTLLSDDEIFKLVDEQLVPNVKAEKYIFYRVIEFGKLTNHIVFVDMTDKVDKLKFTDSSKKALNMTSGKFYLYHYYLQTNSDGSYSFTEPNQTDNTVISLYGNGVRMTTLSNFDLTIDGVKVFHKASRPTVPADVVQTVPVAMIANSQVIIGGTICLLALMIFLVILVRHLWTVSQVS